MTAFDSLPKAVVQLDSYVVRHLALEIGGNWAAVPEIPLRLHLRHSFAVSEDRKRVRVQLQLRARPEKKAKDAPLKLDVTLEGLFSVVDSQGDASVVDRVLHENTVAILFPYLRAVASVVTTMANIPPLTLPVVNVVEMLKLEQPGQQTP